MARRSKTPTQLEIQQNDSDPQKRLDMIRSWFLMEHQRQEVNRYQMALDADYYDGEQWTLEESAVLRNRGQNPTVINEIKPTIDWLKGTERRMRRDFKVLARNTNSPETTDDAEVKTKLLKYIADTNRAPFERSQAFDEMVVSGLGWIEVGVTSDPDDEPIFIRHESWRWMLHDSLHYRRDLSDCRYIFRFKEVDLDIAQAYFPDKAVELEKASNLGDLAQWDEEWSGAWPTTRTNGDATLPARFINFNPESHVFNPRKRVSLVECWHYWPEKTQAGQVLGSLDRTRMRMKLTILTKQDIIWEGWSPYNHNRYPFVPLWAYKRKRDGLPYGVVRQCRGPQDDLNKRVSKSQFLLSANQLLVEEGTIDAEVMPLEEVRDEIAAPDGIAKFAQGALSGNKVKIREGQEFTQGHMLMADRMAATIRSTSGVTQENRGSSQAGQSGRAIIAKQEQGSMVTAELFDNLLFAHQIEGELELANVEQFYDEPKVFSVTGERYKLDYQAINQPDPVTGEVKNPVTAHKAQFVVGEAPWKQALAEAGFESAMNMLGALAPVAPQVVTAIIDLVFEWSDLPNKNEILRRIRAVTNVPDPDEGETPEQAQQKKMQQQLAQKQFELTMAQMQADVDEARAKGIKLEAETIAKRLEALANAAAAAQGLVAVPGVAPVADQLLLSAGFKDMGGEPGITDTAQVPTAQPQQPPAGYSDATDSFAGQPNGPAQPEQQPIEQSMPPGMAQPQPPADGLGQ